MATDKTRVLMIVEYYPQISQTYIKSEIEAVQHDYAVRVIGMKEPNGAYENPYPFERTDCPDRIREVIADWRPHVLHTHYLHNANVLYALARQTGIPFTVRGHSFDIISKGNQTKPSKSLQKAVRAINSEYCVGSLVFPLARPAMERAGVRAEKIVDCYPVVQFRRFYDRSPNGKGVMNVGACLPKKRMEDFVDLACRMPETEFNLFPIGYASDGLREYNEHHGSPVTIHKTVHPDQMPAVYKAHGWLVYTGCRKLKTVGWPMAVAEAQAAGLGVCMPNLRPDIKQYLGGAGFIYDSIDQVPPILQNPYPKEMRERGFEQARKSDISVHKKLLTDLWDRAAAQPIGFSDHSSASVFGILSKPLELLRRAPRRT